MKETTCLSLSADGHAEKPSVRQEGTHFLGYKHPRTGEVLWEGAYMLIFPGVKLQELHSLRGVEDRSTDAAGTLRLFVRRSHLEEFHRELGEFLAKRGQPVEPSAT